MVDGSGLENRHTRKGIGGSNPSLSAIAINIKHLHAVFTCHNLVNRGCLQVSPQVS